MRYFTTLCFCSALAIPNLASANDSTKTTIPMQGNHVAVVTSDDCIVTAGYNPSQPSLLDTPIGYISKTEVVEVDKDLGPDFQKSVSTVIGVLAVELAQSAVKFGVKAASDRLVERAKDKDYAYDNVTLSSLYELGEKKIEKKPIKKADGSLEKRKYNLISTVPVSFNDKVRCVTIVTNVSKIVTAKNGSINTPEAHKNWEEEWNNIGPSYNVTKKRLEAGGFVWSNPFLSTIFEAKWVFSPDAKAVRLEPRYFRANTFLSTNRNGIVEPRYGDSSVAYTVSMTHPGGKKIASETISYQDLTASKKGMMISGIERTRGFGPDWAKIYAQKGGWQQFSPAAYKASDFFKNEFKKEEPKLTLPMQADPINISVKMVSTEEPSKLVKFLAEFLSNTERQANISDAIINDLGLRTDDEDETELLAVKKAKLKRLEAFKKLYEGQNVGIKDTPEYNKALTEYKDAIFKLNVEIAVIEHGCDTTGQIVLANCS